MHEIVLEFLYYTFEPEKFEPEIFSQQKFKAKQAKIIKNRHG